MAGMIGMMGAAGGAQAAGAAGSGMMAQGAGQAMGGVAKQGLLDSAKDASGALRDDAMDLRGGLLDDMGVDETMTEGLGSGAGGHMANVQAGMQRGSIAENNAIQFLARTRALQGQNLGMGGQY